VAYSWSHDLMGPSRDPELTVRWLQWGAYSSIFRLHDRGTSAGECLHNQFPSPLQSECSLVDPWDLPAKHYASVSASMRERSALVPYLYTALRHVYDTGVHVMRPMYYHWPRDDQAYRASSYSGCANAQLCQYMLGEEMLVAPALAPSDNVTSMTSVRVWLPRGTWVEKHSSTVFDIDSPGGLVLDRRYDLSEVPVFIKGGAVIPSLPTYPPEQDSHSVYRQGSSIGGAQRAYSTVVLTVYPGDSKGSCKIYEDDGHSSAYTAGAFGWTHVVYNRNTTHFNMSISSRPSADATSTSNLPFPASRTYVLRLVNAFPPRRVQINGIDIPQAKYDESNEPDWSYTGSVHAGADDNVWADSGEAWYEYNGAQLTSTILIPGVRTSEVQLLTIEGYTLDASRQMSGVSGILRRANLAKRNLDETRQTPGSDPWHGGPAHLTQLASFGEHLSFAAEKSITALTRSLATMHDLVRLATTELRRAENINPRRLAYSQALLDVGIPVALQSPNLFDTLSPQETVAPK